MTCPPAEVLSRWIDGLVPGGKIESHLDGCAACAAKVREIRAAGEWLKRAEPGPSCLSAEQMALLIEGKFDSPHVRSCPRCSAELRDLRPRRKATTKIHLFKPRRSAAPWVAAAAAVLLIGVVALLIVQARRPAPDVATREPHRPAPPKPERIPDLPKPAPRPEPAPPERDPRIGPDAPKPAPEPAPEPKPEPPKPEEPKPEPVVPTRPVEPVRAEAAFALKSGALTAHENGKWIKPAKVLEGMALRAEGRTRLDFAGAQLTLDTSTRFSLSKSEFSLAAGTLTADVPPGSRFSLLLGTSAIIPQATLGRVLLVARDQQVVVEEGSATCGGQLLGENEQFEAKEGRLLPKKTRTIPAAARGRESRTWELELANQNATRGRLDNGRLVTLPSGRRALESTLNEDKTYHEASIRYFAGGDAVTFTVKAATALRFRYFTETATPVLFTIRNRTKDENFSFNFDPVPGRWTTMTILVRDIPVNTGGRKVACEAGDAYGRFGWSLGKPDEKAVLLVDQFEVLEIEK
jgi:hypothetical protein